jgi:pimeloyl-ACP methyl ester carboxylesterase
MTIILVHGNPETCAIWDDLVHYLAETDILRLSPPGFGAPIPEGFDCGLRTYGGIQAINIAATQTRMCPSY